MRYTAELWDQMHFLFQETNDYQIHGAVIFEDYLEEEYIKKAVILSMDAYPILKCRYVERNWRPYWELMDSWNADVVTVVDSDYLEEEIEKFLTGKTDTHKGPQLMVRIIRSPSENALCIVMNHMVCDGAGFKEYLYSLSSIYTNLLRNPDYMPEYKTSGPRSLNQVLKYLPIKDRIKLFTPKRLGKHLAKHDSGLLFPLSDDADISPFIITYRLPSHRLDVLKDYSKKYNVTINDIILAAYFRALYKVLEIKERNSFAIPCALDLRRFLPERKANTFCNLLTTIICDIGPDIGDSFYETVKKVKCEMDEKKSDFLVMSWLATLGILFKLSPYAKVKKNFNEKFKYPIIAMSNIGVIEKSKLVFDNVPVLNAFMTGSIKYRPYFQLALSIFNESITFSSSLYGSEKNKEQINNFYIILDDELRNIETKS